MFVKVDFEQCHSTATKYKIVCVYMCVSVCTCVCLCVCLRVPLHFRQIQGCMCVHVYDCVCVSVSVPSCEFSLSPT